MRIARLTGIAGVALLVAAAPATAIPSALGAPTDVTLEIVVPDPQLLTRVCSVSFTPGSTVRFLSTGIATGTAIEAGRARVSSTGCPSVSWTATVTVVDQSPGHPTYSTTAAGFGNPATASATQSVPYGLGEREAGIVTFTIAASSRLASFCWEDVWEVTALGNPAPVSSRPC